MPSSKITPGEPAPSPEKAEETDDTPPEEGTLAASLAAEAIFLQLCATNPKLAAAADQTAEDALTDAEKEARQVVRHSKMEAAAKDALARFETLTPEDKALVENQGEIANYSPEVREIDPWLRVDPLR